MGYWSQYPDVPKYGWEHEGVEEITDQEFATCEWCEKQQIRYVHYLSHLNWKDSLEVGCVCASKLISDGEKAKSLEKRAKRQTNRRQSQILEIKGQWNISKKGNQYKKFQGLFLVIVSEIGRWKCGYRKLGVEHMRWTPCYDSEEKLKDALAIALVPIIRVKEEL